MRLVIVTDAWAPQVNGVVRTLDATVAELRAAGHHVDMVEPGQFRSLPCPTYPEIRLALAGRSKVGERIEQAAPGFIHIATEGPLGLAARRWCIDRGHRFTTAYHTRFPEYIAKRTRLPAGVFWHYIRWFHAPAAAVMVSTASVLRELASHGIPQGRLWGRGVDLSCFRPGVAPHPMLSRLPRPIQLYVGRVSVEKNLPAFLDSDVPGSKVVVGDGPALPALKRAYPDVSFTGVLSGADLASAYATADVLVFPSRTDTFGLVMIEALACGTPVAALPVAGPADILRDDVAAMHEDLDRAIVEAAGKCRNRCADYGKAFSWSESARQFCGALVPL